MKMKPINLGEALAVVIEFPANFPAEITSDLEKYKIGLRATVNMKLLLDNTLAIAGQLTWPTQSFGPLNKSFFVCGIRQREAAARAVWAMLKRNCLGNVATVYRPCRAEMVWRSLFPRTGSVIHFEKFLEIHDSALQSLMQAIKPKPPGDDGK
jgi:hypothetical protein